MKHLLSIIFLSLISYTGFGQILADPATSQADIQDLSGNSISANTLTVNQVFNFVLPIYNDSWVNASPSSSIKISVNFGTNTIVDPTFNLNSIGPFAGPGATNPYFNWTQTILPGGIIKLTGTSNQPLPANFPSSFTLLDQVVIRMKITNTAGNSSFQANITNNNPSILSDTDPTNNSASLNYSVPSQITDYYRTRQSGNWNDPNTWESAIDADFIIGVASPATLSPDFNANTIIIRNTHTVTITANVTTDQTTINSGGALVVNPNIVFTVNHGTGPDITVSNGASMTIKR